MGKIVGRDGVLKAGTDQIAHVRNWTLSESSPQIDLTAMGDQFADQAAGLPAISGDMALWWDDAADAGQAAIQNGAEFVLEIYPTGEAQGGDIFTVSVMIADKGRSASHDGGVEMNVSWVGRSVVAETSVA